MSEHHRQITWNGTADEALDLLFALSTNCECKKDRGNQRILASCASHLMISEDQRAVDGLLFMRRMAARLLFEEFNATLSPDVGSRESVLDQSPSIEDKLQSPSNPVEQT